MMEPDTSCGLLTRGLGYLGFQHFPPHPALRPWVQCYWSARSSLERSFVEKLYPDGGTSLTVNFVDSARPASSFSASHNLNRLNFGPRLDSFGLHFHPGGAFHLLGIPVGEMTGAVYDARDLGLESFDTLVDQMCAAGPEGRAALAEAWLLRHTRSANPDTGLVTRLWPRLQLSGLNLDQLASNHYTSRRKVERLFREEVGLSPHRLRLLLRVNRARSLIKQRPGRSLTEIGLVCGYYDQAHFIRRFEKVAGVTPGQYQRLQRERLTSGKPQG